MSRYIILMLLGVSVLASLVGCGQTVDEKMDQGIANAESIFKANPEKSTEQVNKIKFYLPSGYEIEASSDDTNIILSKNNNAFVLFNNPNESADSDRFYKSLKADKEANIVKEHSFKQKNRFGFVSVLKSDDKQYEIIVSNGGVKMTTVTNGDDIDELIEQMMQIVRSLKITKK
ncbi:hypothetical protein JFL43_14540 [Viridibacillus sp. YIM B01967]|uniref:Lipoprotein n=1 Tax=Viridibacillus soli TaxID=2798301 RepID=A0ABS1H9G2_9BACL|nr:hypothetical protein [Viridibacillus soli]MBK3496057.1 hypothetical protein [Viridibacillus soli]